MPETPARQLRRPCSCYRWCLLLGGPFSVAPFHEIARTLERLDTRNTGTGGSKTLDFQVYRNEVRRIGGSQ